MAFLRPRKKDRGYGRVFAVLILSTFFYVWPYCADLWWQSQQQIMKDHDLPLKHWFVLWSLFQTFCISIIGNSFFGICYYFEFDFIEKYAIADEPWPWKVLKRDEWMRTLRKTLALYVFNVFILGPFFLGLSLILDLPLDHDVSNKIPSHKDFILQLLFCLLIEDILFYISHCSHTYAM